MNTRTLDQSELLQWWQLYMIQVFRQEADLIRNGVIQDIFAIRRSLELSHQTRNDTANINFDDYFTQLEKVYSQLEDCCNRLELPHIESSLPLALFHAVKPWQKRLCISLELPHDWASEPIELTWLLSLFAKLLSQGLSKDTLLPKQCHMTLQQQDKISTLIFCASFDGLVPSSLATETSRVLQPILETFQILAKGQCQEYHQPHSYTWVLRWNIQPQYFSRENK